MIHYRFFSYRYPPSLSYSLKASRSSVLIASESSSSSVINLEASVQKSSNDNVPIPVWKKKKQQINENKYQLGTRCAGTLAIIEHLKFIIVKFGYFDKKKKITIADFRQFRHNDIFVLPHKATQDPLC